MDMAVYLRLFAGWGRAEEMAMLCISETPCVDI